MKQTSMISLVRGAAMNDGQIASHGLQRYIRQTPCGAIAAPHRQVKEGKWLTRANAPSVSGTKSQYVKGAISRTRHYEGDDWSARADEALSATSERSING